MSEDKQKDFTDPPPSTFQQWADEEFCWFKFFWTLQEFLQAFAKDTHLKAKTLEYHYYKKDDKPDEHLYWCCTTWEKITTLQPLNIDNRTLAQVKRPRKSKSSDSQENPAANAAEPTNEETPSKIPEAQTSESPKEPPQTYSTDEEN
jgi:hypothetical protein